MSCACYAQSLSALLFIAFVLAGVAYHSHRLRMQNQKLTDLTKDRERANAQSALQSKTNFLSTTRAVYSLSLVFCFCVLMRCPALHAQASCATNCATRW